MRKTPKQPIILPLIRKMDDLIASVERWLAIGLFTILTLSLAFNILLRNLSGRSFPSILEWAPALVVWLACIGATLALRTDRHVKLDLLLRYASEKMRRIARVLVDGCGVAVMAILFCAACVFVQNEIEIFGARGWLGSILPIFFGLAGFRFATDGLFVFWGQERPGKQPHE